MGNKCCFHHTSAGWRCQLGRSVRRGNHQSTLWNITLAEISCVSVKNCVGADSSCDQCSVVPGLSPYFPAGQRNRWCVCGSQKKPGSHVRYPGQCSLSSGCTCNSSTHTHTHTHKRKWQSSWEANWDMNIYALLTSSAHCDLNIATETHLPFQCDRYPEYNSRQQQFRQLFQNLGPRLMRLKSFLKTMKQLTQRLHDAFCSFAFNGSRNFERWNDQTLNQMLCAHNSENAIVSMMFRWFFHF